MEMVTDKQAIQSGLRIFRPHMNLAKKTAIEFSYLTKKELLTLVARQNFNWSLKDIAQVMNCDESRISHRIKGALAKIGYEISL